MIFRKGNSAAKTKLISTAYQIRNVVPLDQLSSSICATRMPSHTEFPQQGTDIFCPYLMRYHAWIVAASHASSLNELRRRRPGRGPHGRHSACNISISHPHGSPHR